MISTLLEHFLYLWILFKNFLLLSWTRAPHSLTLSTGHVTAKENASSHPSSPDSSSTEEDPSEDLSYELHTVQVSFNKVVCEEGKVQVETSFLSACSSSDDIASTRNSIRSHDSYSSLATAVDHLGRLSPRRLKDGYEEFHAATFEQVFDTSDSEAGYGVTGITARDTPGRHFVVDEDLVEDFSSSRHLKDDNDSFDDLLPLGYREKCEAPDWIQIVDTMWANEVADAMHTFRSCVAEGEDPLALRPEENLRLSFERRMSRHKQLQDIQKWRSDTGSEAKISKSSSIAKYSLIPTFQFP